MPAKAIQPNSALLLEAFVLWNLLSLTRQLRGQPPKKHLTHLEVSDVSRGQSRDAEKHCCSLQCFTAETVGGNLLNLHAGLPARRRQLLSVSLPCVSAPSQISPSSSNGSSFLLCLSSLRPPLLKCRRHTCAAEICPAGLISSNRWYLKPLAALHKTLAWTVFVCVFV